MTSLWVHVQFPFGFCNSTGTHTFFMWDLRVLDLCALIDLRPLEPREGSPLKHVNQDWGGRNSSDRSWSVINSGKVGRGLGGQNPTKALSSRAFHSIFTTSLWGISNILILHPVKFAQGNVISKWWRWESFWFDSRTVEHSLHSLWTPYSDSQ